MGTRAFIILVAAAGLNSACLGDYMLKNNDDAGSMGVDDGGPGGSTDPVTEFAEKVQPIIAGSDGHTGACGACHGAGGTSINFLAPKPTILDGLLSYPGIVGKTPQTSRMYAKGQHDGPALTPAQQPIIANWIINWNLNGPKVVDMGPPKPIIKPFAPVMGANTIDLSVLDSAAAGMTVTFTASVSGTNLLLTQLKVKTSASLGLHIVHPLFVTWDPQFNATPDPIDSFSNLDQSVPSNMTVTLGPGTLVLPNFQSGYMLNLVFGTLEPKMIGGGDGGVVSGCKPAAVTNFAANVRPIIAAQCYNCHNAASPPAGYSMSAALSDQAQCDASLTEVNLTTPASSILLQKPDPGVAGHNGANQKITNIAGFQTAVTNWINIQKM